MARHRDPSEPNDSDDEVEIVVDTSQSAPKAKPQRQYKHKPAVPVSSTPLPAISAPISLHTSLPSSSSTDINGMRSGRVCGCQEPTTGAHGLLANPSAVAEPTTPPSRIAAFAPPHTILVPFSSTRIGSRPRRLYGPHGLGRGCGKGNRR